MSQRIHIHSIAPQALKGLLALEEIVDKSTLEKTLLHLVKVRASQLNACAHCLNLHTKAAIKAGETTQRLFLLNAWKETKLYTQRERLALELTEQLTLSSKTRLSSSLYTACQQQFSQEETVALVLAVAAINCWNRRAIVEKGST